MFWIDTSVTNNDTGKTQNTVKLLLQDIRYLRTTQSERTGSPNPQVDEPVLNELLSPSTPLSRYHIYSTYLNAECWLHQPVPV